MDYSSYFTAALARLRDSGRHRLFADLERITRSRRCAGLPENATRRAGSVRPPFSLKSGRSARSRSFERTTSLRNLINRIRMWRYSPTTFGCWPMPR
jgi:hypothetical protein